MTTSSFFWLLTASAPISLAFGALLYQQWIERRNKRQRRLPKYWPLGIRPLVNSEEALAWNWLVRAFYDHHIMVKLPVTRFTLPRDKEQGMHWYRVLGSVYCTFTICKADGRVIGCLDVPGKAGLARSTRALKQSLLTQCGLPYWIIRSDALPTMAEIRAEFLGESLSAQGMREREMEERAIIAAKASLRTALNRQRSSRNNDFGPSSNWSNSSPSVLRPEDGSSEWQANSFLIPLDSRQSDLL
jgi:hypothetical protein